MWLFEPGVDIILAVPLNSSKVYLEQKMADLLSGKTSEDWTPRNLKSSNKDG